MRRFGRHLEHRDVRRHVAADHRGGEIPAVLQRYGDFSRVINDMRVCNDVAVFCIKDDTGACALELTLAGAHVGDVEEPAEEGSSSSGFCGERSRMVPRVAMFTTAGETRLIMGASVGIGVSPTAGGSAAWLATGSVANAYIMAIRRVFARMGMVTRILKR